MSSNIRLNKICQYCEKQFTAKTTVTKYCGDGCAKKAYKKRKRQEKITKSIAKPEPSLQSLYLKPVKQENRNAFLSQSSLQGVIAAAFNSSRVRNLGSPSTSLKLLTVKTLLSRSQLKKYHSGGLRFDQLTLRWVEGFKSYLDDKAIEI